jgi:hypothetical protein
MLNLPNERDKLTTSRAKGLSRRARMMSLTFLSDSLMTRFLKQDVAAEQKGMSGTTGWIQMQRAHLSQPPGFVLKSLWW